MTNAILIRIRDRIKEAELFVESGNIYNLKWAERYLEDTMAMLRLLEAILEQRLEEYEENDANLERN